MCHVGSEEELSHVISDVEQSYVLTDVEQSDVVGDDEQSHLVCEVEQYHVVSDIKQAQVISHVEQSLVVSHIEQSLKKLEKSHIRVLTEELKAVEQKQATSPRRSKCQEIIYQSAEINKVQTRKSLQKINETKSGLVEKSTR